MKDEIYADVILPLAVKGTFTYRIPESLTGRVLAGARAIVSFGSKKLYTVIIKRVHKEKPDYKEIKEIIDVIDRDPLISEIQLKFWEWISDYYMCYEGEVMKAAVPSGFCPESETLLRINPEFSGISSLDEPSLKLFNIIEKKKTVRLKSLPSVAGNRSVLRLISNMILNGAVIAGESVRIKPGIRTEKHIVLARKFTVRETEALLDSLKKAPRQKDLLSQYLEITDYTSCGNIIPVKKDFLLMKSGALGSTLSAMEKKRIFLSVDLESGREERRCNSEVFPEPLSDLQEQVYKEIKKQFITKKVVLLQGVTSSGKTQIYIHLIKEYLGKGKQVLYLLPEIALTTQIIDRLRKYFGPVTGIYHSRCSDNEKLELWRKVSEKDPSKRAGLILGVRSSVFLPFAELGLIIVDEEHDMSYKQNDPAPRYHARDCAIMLASFTDAVILLGSATPSLESYFNAMNGKYGFVELKERYGKVNLPEIILVNTREAYRKRLMVSHFSPQLLEAVEEALKRKEQILLFRNRRGFSPYLECAECGWVPLCSRCAVNLTYHREINRVVCHYCGYHEPVPVKCPSCGSLSVETRGYGTEKIEDEIKLLFPGARVARMDQDTTRKADSFNRIIKDFEACNTDILVGTQMISKGLDFENLTVVGILNADSMLNYPDFRSYERAYQLMAQVSGRAGRRKKHGKVIIQTSDPEHRIMRFVLRNDYRGFYELQIEERKTFGYPPFCRLIRITLKHKDRMLLDEFSGKLGRFLHDRFGSRVLGPEYPLIYKIQFWYIKEILIKIDRDKSLSQAKASIRDAVEQTRSMEGASILRIAVDVDPY